jgi:hypothetical protein
MFTRPGKHAKARMHTHHISYRSPNVRRKSRYITGLRACTIVPAIHHLLEIKATHADVSAFDEPG